MILYTFPVFFLLRMIREHILRERKWPVAQADDVRIWESGNEVVIRLLFQKCKQRSRRCKAVIRWCDMTVKVNLNIKFQHPTNHTFYLLSLWRCFEYCFIISNAFRMLFTVLLYQKTQNKKRQKNLDTYTDSLISLEQNFILFFSLSTKKS